MLRALESTGIFAQTEAGIFENTPASDCLRRSKPGSNWAWIRFTLCPGRRFTRAGAALPHRLRTAVLHSTSCTGQKPNRLADHVLQGGSRPDSPMHVRQSSLPASPPQARFWLRCRAPV